MSLQTSSAQITPDQVVDLRSINLSSIDRGPAQFRSRAAGNEITLSLVHLDVALALKAEARDAAETDYASCFKVSAKPLANRAEAADEVDKSDDLIMRRLADALAATEAADDSHSAICADALRLAILTRQVSRHTDPEQNEAADETGRNVRSLQKWRLKRVLQYVDEQLGEKISLQDLATVAGLSRMHFAAQFRAAMGMRPHEYLLKRRIERAEEMLKQAEVSLVDVALTVGFQTQAHFTTVFKRFAGDTPYQWRSAWLAQSTPLLAVRRGLS